MTCEEAEGVFILILFSHARGLLMGSYITDTYVLQ